MTRFVAEALRRNQRLRLLRQLHQHGLTDEQIAHATSYTTYTAARLLRSLDLAPNPSSPAGSPHRPGTPSKEGDGPDADPLDQTRVLALR